MFFCLFVWLVGFFFWGGGCCNFYNLPYIHLKRSSFQLVSFAIKFSIVWETNMNLYNFNSVRQSSLLVRVALHAISGEPRNLSGLIHFVYLHEFFMYKTNQVFLCSVQEYAWSGRRWGRGLCFTVFQDPVLRKLCPLQHRALKPAWASRSS